MIRFLAATAVVSLLVSTAPTAADAGGHPPPSRFTPGAAGVGDPYYPLDGNGGYDVRHYALDITYDPASDVLVGVATIRAKATQNLSSFNLDLEGLTVRSVTVNNRTASFSRDAHELTIVPARGLNKRSDFVVVVRYDGIPQSVVDPVLGSISGFIATDDGALIAGQPHVAATWFPVNDHPSDAASYIFDVTVPEGLEAVANGVLTKQRTRNGWTTWTWDAKEPMASYLTTATIGDFDLHAYKANGIKYWDAIDPDLFVPPVVPHTGEQVLLTQQADSSYQRVTRTLAVPAEGADLTFWVARSTEPDWDYFFVEARHAGGADWTTLPEASGITSGSTGLSCPYWHSIHPFLTNYQTDNGDDTCSPLGTSPATGSWNAVTGESSEWTLWTIDLGAYAGSDVEISLAYASDDVFQLPGVAVDDIVVSTGEGSTSFEADGDALDGWVVSGPPADSPGNSGDWFIGGAADLPPALGQIAIDAFARQPEIIDFLAGYFGPYPFKASGGIVDDVEGLGFALETQTRPVYSKDFFTDPVRASFVIVHEQTHQWFGDNLRLQLWQDIWLNEGFATYAEWLWNEHEGFNTPQEIFDFFATDVPPDDPLWSLTIGDPGPDRLFDGAVYTRGALTLQALRIEVGDDAFFKILRKWAKQQAGDTVTTAEFIALAESISGQELDALFDTWLYTATKPDVAPVATAARAAAVVAGVAGASPARSPMSQWGIDKI